MDTKEMLYVVGFFEGDDSVGGLNVFGIYSSRGMADEAVRGLIFEYDNYGWFTPEVFEIPLNTPGYLGYRMNKFNEWK